MIKNKKGLFDFDFDVEQIIPIGFGLFGAFIAWFTAKGGFSQAVTGQAYHAPFITLIGAPIVAGIGGYFWGWWMVNK